MNLFPTTHADKFHRTYANIATTLLKYGDHVDTGHWQALSDVPQTKTVEIHNAVLTLPIPMTAGALASAVEPNLPWAEDHFQERMGGEPLNPGEQYKNWPWYRGNVEQHQTEENLAFSHSYMERIWPRWAGISKDMRVHWDNGREGIRYRYGDLYDVLDLLAKEPYTRQAYLPIWFPEDTGAHHGERVPCTLGYHLMMRKQRLHCFYPMRSLDFLRYLRDDMYMAGRLVQEVIARLAKIGEVWQDVIPGTLTLVAASLHVFEGDLPSMKRKYS